MIACTYGRRKRIENFAGAFFESADGCDDAFSATFPSVEQAVSADAAMMTARVRLIVFSYNPFFPAFLQAVSLFSDIITTAYRFLNV